MTGLSIVAIASAPLLFLASPVPIVAGVAIAARGRRQAREAARQLECLLDSVEQGARAPAITRAVRHLTRAAAKTSRRDSWL
jgi:hypothetical protein